MHHGYMTLWDKKKTPPAQWFIDPTNPSRLRWWDGRAWTDHCAPISPDGSLSGTPGFSAQVVSAQVVSVPAVTPSTTTTSAVSASMDDDPSDVLRRVQSEMVPVKLDLPLDEQVEVVGEQYHPKEIRKLFRECGLPITSAGATLEEEMCYLVPEPWNPHDSNAVAVMIRTYQVGHLPAELAKRYHPRLIGYAKQRQLVTGVARIWSRLESGAMVRARVTIAVPEVTVLLSRRRARGCRRAHLVRLR